VGKSCLSWLIGLAFILASLSPWEKYAVLCPFSVGSEVMQQQVGLAFSCWCWWVPRWGWWPKRGQWAAFNRHRAPFHAAAASKVTCHCQNEI